MEINCMVVDDDEISRLLVKKFIDKTDFLKLTYEFDSAIKASEVLTKDSPSDVDLVFLDVEIPEMSGIDLMNKLNNSYPIIMTTSKEDYAIDAFEGNVADYLVKPFEYSRFLKAAVKVKEQIEKEQIIAESNIDIFVKSDSKLERLEYDQIFYVEALADYVIFNTSKGKKIVHHTMKGIEKRLPNSTFIRVHRSYIVNLKKIDFLEDMQIHTNEKIIPVGSSYKERFLSSLNML